MERRLLRDITTTGWRRSLRSTVFNLAIAGSLVTLVSLLFAKHRLVGYAPSHPEHLLVDTTLLPLLGVILIFLALRWAVHGQLVAAVVLGPFVVAAALGTLYLMASNHPFLESIPNTAEHASYLGLVGLAILGASIFVVEWIVVIAERNHLESSEPVFAIARVVRRG